MTDSLIMEMKRTYNKERRLEILWEIVKETHESNPHYSSGEKMSIARGFEIDGGSFVDETLGLGGHWQFGSGSFRSIWYDFVPLLATRHTSPMTIGCCNGLY